MADTPLPAAILILCTSSTAPGHVLPICAIATHLTSLNHPVTFVGGTQHRSLIERSGSAFFPVHASLTLEHGPFREWGASRARYAEGLPRMVRDFETFFVGQVAGQVESTRAALEAVKKGVGRGREVVVVCETMWFGYLPWKWGRGSVEGYEGGMPRSLGVNVTPLMLDGEGTPVFPLGMLPAVGGEGSERDGVLREWLYRYVVRGAYEGFRDRIREAGGVDVPDEWMVNLSVTAHDTTLQLCHPALEYPRPDLPAHVKFAGNLPPNREVPSWFQLPDWWSVVAGNAELPEGSPTRRSVVVVSQGTLARDYSMLLAPTIRAFAGRTDVVVVALLGKQGLEVPPGVLPAPEEGIDVSNVYVVDFVPYDLVLSVADVMVFNAGYGGFMHCVAHGVPVVAAGLTEDKAEVAARVEWTGVGINLRTGRPSVQAVRDAVERITGTHEYRTQAKKLAKEVAKGNPLKVVEEELRALTRGNEA